MSDSFTRNSFSARVTKSVQRISSRKRIELFLGHHRPAAEVQIPLAVVALVHSNVGRLQIPLSHHDKLRIV